MRWCARLGGRLLTALAEGADALGAPAHALAKWSDVVGPVNTEAHLRATKLRFELMALAGGGDVANAILRAATRGKRLLGAFRS